MERESKIEQSEKFPVAEALHTLQCVMGILRGMGLKVIDEIITEDTLVSNMPFPIVRDGVDGIRVEYSKRRGLKIWFTNGFQDPNNPKRREIEKRLNEEGLL